MSSSGGGNWLHRGLLLGLLLVATGLGIWRATRNPGPPNIVLIVVDSLRQDFLGCYGFQGDISPSIDRLASRSVVFESAVSAAPWTPPSIASLFTSLHVPAHGLRGVAQPRKEPGGGWAPFEIAVLDEGIPTLASSLQQAGYETAAYYANDWLTPEAGLGRGFEHYIRVAESAESVTPQVLGYLESRSSERPFFLYLHFMDVHGPYTCSRGNYDLLKSSPTFPPDRRLTDAEDEALGRLKDLPRLWPSEKLKGSLRFWNVCYAAGVRTFDQKLDGFLDAFERQRRLRNTVVVFTSDHGEGLLEHGKGAMSQRGSEHGFSLHFHQTRVPLMIRLPNRKYAGSRISAPVSLVDIMPTLLTLAGAQEDFPMHGRDLMPMVRDGGEEEPRESRRRVFSTAVQGKPRVVAVQDDTRKLIWLFPDDTLLLYNIAEDPLETTDIASGEAQVVEELKEVAMGKLGRYQEGAAPASSTAVLNEAVVEKLKALGYLE
jgi:arylsulfatase A-like enzyme